MRSIRTTVLAAIGFAILALAATAQVARACDSAQEQANKKIAIAFYDAAINQKNFAAASKYLGNRYTQHDPMAANGPQGLKKFIAWLRKNKPKAHVYFKQVFTDGPYVIMHVHTVVDPGTRGLAVMDIFKLEHGKVVEHWDVAQPIPAKSANDNGMF